MVGKTSQQVLRRCPAASTILCFVWALLIRQPYSIEFTHPCHSIGTHTRTFPRLNPCD